MSFSFKNKKILLLGPAPHAYRWPINVEKYDFVARINHSIPVRGVAKQMSGSRCEIYYPNPQLLLSPLCFLPGIETIRTDFSFRDRIPVTQWVKYSCYNFSFDKYCKKIGCNLNTGMCAILDIFLGEPAEFRIEGISFFREEEPYYQGYASKVHTRLMKATKGNISSHNQTLQFNYFKKCIYPHVEVSQTLTDLCTSTTR